MVATYPRLTAENYGRAECATCCSPKPIAHRHYHDDGSWGIVVPSASNKGRTVEAPLTHFFHEVTVTIRGLFVCSCERGQVIEWKRAVDEVAQPCPHMTIRYLLDKNGLEESELTLVNGHWALFISEEGEEL